MKGRIYTPKQLHAVVKECWEIVADDDETILTQVIPPVAVPEIIFFLNSTYQIRGLDVKAGFIKGQYTVPQTITLCQGYHLFGIRLHPFGLKQLFHIDARGLTDHIVDIKEQPLTIGLQELLAQYKSIDHSLIRLILQMIGEQPRGAISWETTTFLALLKNNNNQKVTELISNTGIGMRTLQRNFIREVGLSPKKYMRILRMTEIEPQLKTQTNWFDVVETFGFADQSHLIKEFKLLRSTSPAELLKKKLTLHDQLPVPERIDV